MSIDEKIIQLLFAVEQSVAVLSGYIHGTLIQEHCETKITVDESEVLFVANDTKKQNLTVDFQFTKKEIDKMTKDFKKKYLERGLVLNVRAKGDVYEIRYRRDGKCLSASSKNLNEAKAKMRVLLLQAYGVKEPEKVKEERKNALQYFLWYIEDVKTPKHNARYVKNLIGYVNVHLRPLFRDRYLSEIAFAELQRLINNLSAAGKNRTAKGIRTLLIEVYRSAVYDGLVKINHAARLAPVIYEQEHGRALTLEDEKRVLRAILLSESAHRNDFLIMLFAGLRPCEVKSVRYEGDFLIVRCAKKRTGSEPIFRKVPMTPLFRRYVDITVPIDPVETRQLEKSLDVLFGGKINLYDFRHTFITRSKECGVPEEVVQTWVGHSARTLTGKTYTHFSDAFMLKEAEKLNY